MTPEQLRASILQQAMEGKLVKQDPNDEPASILLEKITKEKARLIKEKKIKRTKKLPEITDDEKPFEIPDSWEWVRLETISNFVGTGIVVPKAKQYNSNNNGSRLPYFKMNNIGNWNGKFDIEGLVYIENVPKVNNYLLEEAELLFNTRNSRELVGKTTVVPKLGSKKVVANNNILRIKLLGGISSKFVNYYFISPRIKQTLFNLTSATTNVAAIYQKQLLALTVLVPPLAEQKRIVAKLDQIMPSVDEYAEAYDKLKKLDDGFNDKLKQSLLQYAMEGKLVKQNSNDEPASELLKKIKDEKKQLVKEKKIKRSKSLPRISEDEKLFDIPENWEWVRLTEVGSWGAGATPSRSHPEYYNGGIPWLKTGDLNDGVISSTSETISQAGADNSSVRFNQPGNILIAMYGATIGKLGIAGISLTTNQACCGCKTFDGIYNWYLFYYLLAMRPLLIDQGSGGAQPNISKTKIEKFPFALPPFEEQKRIVTKIEKLMPLLVE